jgi:FixJ family two-component response regulator
MNVVSTLCDKERNILESIAEGYTNKEIATALNVALKR